MVQFTWIAYVDVFRSLGSVLTVNAGFAVNVLTCARARAIPPLDDDPDPELLPAELLPAELLLLQPAARVATTTTAAATPAARFQLILNLHRSVSSDPDRGRHRRGDPQLRHRRRALVDQAIFPAIPPATCGEDRVVACSNSAGLIILKLLRKRRLCGSRKRADTSLSTTSTTAVARRSDRSPPA